MLKHYKIYEVNGEDVDAEKDEICIEHPSDDEHSLCGRKIDQTPDGNPEETEEDINCKYCLQTIYEILRDLP